MNDYEHSTRRIIETNAFVFVLYILEIYLYNNIIDTINIIINFYVGKQYYLFRSICCK